MSAIYNVEENSCRTVPQIPVPAETSYIFKLISEILHQASTFHHQLKRRRRFVALLNYDDHMIEDMGLTRAAIEEASKLPLKLNAAHIARIGAKQNL